MDNEHGFARDRNTGLWIDHSDRLYCEAYSSVASLQVIFSGYFRKHNGEIAEFAVPVNPTSDRVVTSNQIHFGPGFLLSCTAHLQSGNANRGQCYVRARVQRSTGTPLVVMHQLLGGYLSDTYSPSFPFGNIEGSLTGPGMLRSIAGTNPAAGAESTETVPTGALWRLATWRATLVCDATAANRRLNLLIDDGTTTLFNSVSATQQTATQTQTYNAAILGAVLGANDAQIYIMLPPDLRLPTGFRIVTSTSNLQAGDNWGAPQLLVEEWLEA